MKTRESYSVLPDKFLTQMREATAKLQPPEARYDRIHRVKTASDVLKVMGPAYAALEVEEFVVLCLDAKNVLKRKEVIARGQANVVAVHPREVFVAAIRFRAVGIIAVHNHPTGDANPSADDVLVTERLATVGKLLAIPLLDHVIIGGGTCDLFSFLDSGRMPGPVRVGTGW